MTHLLNSKTAQLKNKISQNHPNFRVVFDIIFTFYTWGGKPLLLFQLIFLFCNSSLISLPFSVSSPPQSSQVCSLFVFAVYHTFPHLEHTKHTILIPPKILPVFKKATIKNYGNMFNLYYIYFHIHIILLFMVNINIFFYI